MSTLVQDMIQKYGVDNIFMVREDYHGLYEDDYCDFTYYNNVTGEFSTDKWSTAYAAPDFKLFECMWISEALKNNLLDTAKFFSILFNNEMNRIKNNTINTHDIYYESNRDRVAALHLKVNVSRGRKFKGSGYWVSNLVKTFQWATPQWHSHYYGDNGYGRTSTVYAKIYVPETNKIEYANISYLEIENLSEMINEYKKYLISNLLKTTKENVYFENSGIGYYLKYENPSFINWLCNNKKNELVMSNLFDAEEEKREKKNNEFRDKKMPELIEWVKTHTEKTCDKEICELAERIYKKRYGRN